MNPNKLMLASLLLAVACSNEPGTPPPAQVVVNPAPTDIWVAELLESGRRLRVGPPQNITDRAGYDNQPHFLPDGSAFLYTSIGRDGQADIHIHELESGRSRQLTRTPEGEYSPTPLPDGGFAVIRVEMDGTQRLWRFNARGSDPVRLLDDIEPVGYMAWADAYRVGLFVLGEPHALVIADIRTGEGVEVLRSVGRSMHPVPGEDTISIVHKESEDAWHIIEVRPDTGETRWLAPALAPAEDFAWTPDGQLLMARGGSIYLRRPGPGNEWSELADFSAHGITQITRIAVSPNNDRIAMVVQRD